ncbi:MAG: proline--tRNA ligase [Spirochaetaceae bacterium]|jgi:prolyl-tRNA synthetase|nr:proline--tRNA ligase [Spirochaetaceae bacterium]
MKYTQYYIPTLREVPNDAVIVSHRLMLRAALIRKLANGLFAYLPLGLRSFRKLEAIIREEMAAIGCLELKPTVVVPGEFWKESGRWDAMGDSMLRAKNRTGGDFVVSPTAEEAITALLRDDLASYRQLPLSVYQINTKYRDEIRPRYGVMRGREFVMKDAYSYHTSEASLDKIYRDMDTAYRRVFARCGLATIPVSADSGAMGGSGSQEFMVESDIGDNTLLLCPTCGYAANVEKAECANDGEDFENKEGEVSPSLQTRTPVDTSTPKGASAPPSVWSSATPSPRGSTPKTPDQSVARDGLQKIDTPHVRTIEELCAFMHTVPQNFVKTLIYRAVNIETPEGLVPEAFYAACIRGDLEVNETKLAALLKAAEVALAADMDVTRITGAPVGFAGPVGLRGIPIIADRTATGGAAMTAGAVTGANEADKHYANVVFGRDWKADLIADIRTVVAGDHCVHCGAALYEKKGNELGHIFKLGYKYTKSMNVTYLDENGKAQIPVMGSYGIGLDRTLASVIEAYHDEAGILWPATLAPFHAVIVPIKYEGAVKETADTLEHDLAEWGIEVLLDDRPERPGVKFADADLIGCPYRIVVGDKNLSQSPPAVEVKRRGEKEARLVPAETAAAEIALAIRQEIAALNGAQI